jgi:hypothetical protein
VSIVTERNRLEEIVEVVSDHLEENIRRWGAWLPPVVRILGPGAIEVLLDGGSHGAAESSECAGRIWLKSLPVNALCTGGRPPAAAEVIASQRARQLLLEVGSSSEKASASRRSQFFRRPESRHC